MKRSVLAVLGAAIAAWSCAPSQAEGNASAGSAAREAWTSLRAERDSARVAATYARLRGVRDSALFGAARALMLDSTATVPARVSSAMLVVAQLVDGAEPDYHTFAATGPHEPCTTRVTSRRATHDGAPLPPNAGAAAESTALRVIASASAPQPVRNAARCVYDAVAGPDPALAAAPRTASDAGHVTESSGRFDTTDGRVGEPAARAPGRAPRGDSVRATAPAAPANPSCTYDGARVHVGTLRRATRGDVLETDDGRRLPVANVPSALARADGMRVWIAEPLGAPTRAGLADPGRPFACPR